MPRAGRAAGAHPAQGACPRGGSGALEHPEAPSCRRCPRCAGLSSGHRPQLPRDASCSSTASVLPGVRWCWSCAAPTWVSRRDRSSLIGCWAGAQPPAVPPRVRAGCGPGSRSATETPGTVRCVGLSNPISLCFYPQGAKPKAWCKASPQVRPLWLPSVPRTVALLTRSGAN